MVACRTDSLKTHTPHAHHTHTTHTHTHHTHTPHTSHTHTQMMSHPGVRGAITVVYLPSLDEVTALKQTGVMEHDDVLKVTSYVCIASSV